MIAYAIKNKEGKYWCGNDIFSTTIDIRKIYICEDFDFINIVIDKLLSESLLKDCKVVEITITEGDLEHQLSEKDKELDKILAIYKRALELACENIRDMYCSDYCVCTRDERCKGKCCYEQYYDKEKFLNQAKKELEKEGE